MMHSWEIFETCRCFSILLLAFGRVGGDFGWRSSTDARKQDVLLGRGVGWIRKRKLLPLPAKPSQWERVLALSRGESLCKVGLRNAGACSCLQPHVKHLSCRFYGSYEVLDGGINRDALVDVTGGLSHSTRTQEVKNSEIEDTFERIGRNFGWNTLVLAGINVHTSQQHKHLSNFTCVTS